MGQDKKTLIKILLITLVVLVGCSKNMVPDETTRLSSNALPPDIEALSKSPTIQGNKLEEHTLVAKNDQYALYLMPDTLSIIVEDIHSGALMRSTVKEDTSNNTENWQTFMKSGVTIEYIKGTNLVPERIDLIKGSPDVQIGYFDEGFSARVYYDEFEIGYDITVTLLESGIQVDIPEASLIESSDDYKIGNIYVFPFLGYSKPGEQEGYMFIPDGTGALIYLEDNHGKYRQPYSEKVYGTNIGIDDPYVVTLFAERFDPINEGETIMAPIYGKVHTDDELAMFAIIEEGYASATIQAYPNGAVTEYDWITSVFVYRQVYNQLTSQTSGTIPVRQKERNHFDISIRYEFFSGEEATYVEAAKFYRDYLLEKGDLVYADTSYKTRLDFLGAEQENWLTSQRIVSMTTTEQVEEILETLVSQGMTDILGVYRGWQKDGLYGGLPVTKYKPESELGGKSGIKSLLTMTEEKDIPFYLEIDPLTVNADKNKTMQRETVKKLNKSIYTKTEYRTVYRDFYYLLPEVTRSNMNSSASSYLNNGIDHLMITGISNNVFSYLHKDNIYDRQSTLNTYIQTIEEQSNQFELVLDKPFKDYWKYTSAIVNMPTGGSKYIFTSEEVPFFPIVFKGVIPMYSEYANFQANQEVYRLKMIEQGIYPSFILTYEDPAKLLYTNSNEIYSSKFEYYEELLLEYDRDFKEIASYVGDAKIEDYTKENDVAVVTYDNGYRVYVNYNVAPVTIDNVTIEGMSYKVGEIQ